MARSYGRGFRAVQALTGPFTPEPTTISFLLDTLSASAVVAYSTRKLRSAYAGSAIRVRRDSDNTEQDIGFSGNDLDTASMATFVGANNGLLTKIYDQSVGGAHGTQTTAAKQPTVVSAGTNITQNGHVAFQTTSGSMFYVIFTITQSQPYTICVCHKLNATTVSQNFTGSDDGATGPFVATRGGALLDYYMLAGGTFFASSGVTADTNCHGLIAAFNSPTSNLYRDNTNIVLDKDVGSNAFLANHHYGQDNGNVSLDCNFCEYLVFSSVLSAGDRSLIRTSWQTYWGAP